MKAGDPAYPKAMCLALVDGVEAVLRLAADTDRRADKLLAVASTIGTKGAQPVIERLLNQDSVLASAPGSNLSRWAASRLFARGRSDRSKSQSSVPLLVQPRPGLLGMCLMIPGLYPNLKKS
nr:DUF1403 family protein [Shinella sp.]